jgi:transcriptional regulator with XRE-family HTH domain
MGLAERPRPARLAEKLLHIRRTLNLSQNGLLRALGVYDEHYREDVSKFELDLREPSGLLLLRYARLVNVCVEVLLDDNLDMPRRLPASTEHSRGVRVRKKKRTSPPSPSKKKPASNKETRESK